MVSLINTTPDKEKNMRIGEFSTIHGVTQNTVRHYLDMGLLATVKNGGQYVFRESDQKDMEQIKELKSLAFSLEEIKTILAIQRLSGPKSTVVRNFYLSYLTSKKKEIAELISDYQKIKAKLDSKIEQTEKLNKESNHKLGFPLAALSMLRCPDCNDNLDVSQGLIDDNMIMSAKINCSCDYSADIVEGIYLDKKSMRKKLINGKQLPTKEEYLRQASDKHINYLYQGMGIMIDYLKKHANVPLFILEICKCSGFFLFQYLEDIPKEATYVLSEYDFDRIRSLKEELEELNEHKKFLFLCCDDDRIPFADASMNVLIDFMSLQPHTDVKREETAEKMLDKLSDNGLYVASFSCSPNDMRKLPEKWLDLFSEHTPQFTSVLPEFDQIDTTRFYAMKDSLQKENQDNKEHTFQMIYVGKKSIK